MDSPSFLSTHPTHSYTQNHHPGDFKSAVEEIRDAVRKGLPRTQAPFQDVSVFLFHWKNDDIGVSPLEDRLAEVFSKLYHYKVERYVIDHAPADFSPSFHLSRAMVDFMVRRNGPHNLLIYVYSGHAWSGHITWES